MTTTTDYNQAGVDAFGRGEHRIVPRSILVEFGTDAARAWYRGWDSANLAADVDLTEEAHASLAEVRRTELYGGRVVYRRTDGFLMIEHTELRRTGRMSHVIGHRALQPTTRRFAARTLTLGDGWAYFAGYRVRRDGVLYGNETVLTMGACRNVETATNLVNEEAMP